MRSKVPGPHEQTPESRASGPLEEAGSAKDLGPVLELLQRGTPENGIDLVPRWERFLAAEQDRQRSAGSRPSQPQGAGRRWLPQLACYAAVLMVGVLVGTLAARATGWGLATPTPVGRCDYSPQQRDLMFRLLDQTRPPTTETVRLASVELAGCVGCHQSALRRPLADILP